LEFFRKIAEGQERPFFNRAKHPYLDTTLPRLIGGGQKVFGKCGWCFVLFLSCMPVRLAEKASEDLHEPGQ
jgi:hypothetical protein